MSLATAPAPTVDLCYVENTADRDVVLKYRGPDNRQQTFVFRPGERKLAPRDAINTWFGDPALADHPTDPRRKSRTEAARRVACFWGIFRDQQWEDENGNSRFPTHLKVYDFDGNLLPTVHLDPYGRMLSPVDEQELSQAGMVDQMRQMQRVLAQLQAQLDEAGIDPTAVESNPEPVAVDKPEASDPEGGAVPDSSSTPKAKTAIRNRTVKPK